MDSSLALAPRNAAAAEEGAKRFPAEKLNQGKGSSSSGEMLSARRRLSLLTAATALANLAPSVTVSSDPEPHQKVSGSAESEDVGKTDEQKQGCDHLRKRFPEVLMDVLSYEPAKDMIKWLPDGKGFIITAPFDLSSEILPKFFKHSQFESFVRKLNRWGFRRVARGKCVGAFYHEHFVRDKPDLCRKMKNRTSVANRARNAGASGAAAAAARDRAAAVPAGQLAAAYAAGLRRPPGVGVELNDPRLSVGMMKFPMTSAMKLRMAGIAPPGMPGDGAVKVFSMEDAMAGFSLKSAMSLKLRSAGMGLPPQLRHPFPSSRGVSPSSASSKLVRNKPAVKAAFLRHQQLLIKTQESRAMLQKAGLMAKPQAC